MVEIQLMGLCNHESRHYSHRNEDIQEARIAEDTPLLGSHRLPAAQGQQGPAIGWSYPAATTTTTIVVTLLIILLLSGVIIGIYLLVLQSRSENVLPPVQTPLQLVSRAQWDRGGVTPGVLTMTSPLKARQVIVVQTETKQCHSSESCIELLREMQNSIAGTKMPLPYNFLISSNGQTYEGLGWRRHSPLFPQHSSLSLVLAFIGNFTSASPTVAQVEEAKNFIAESVSRQYLEPLYTVFGRKIKSSPKGLWSTMKQIPRWSTDLSDSLNA